MGGTKHDNDKLRMDLVPPSAIEALAGVLGFGAKKYGDYNWKKGIKHSRLYAAALRHLMAYWQSNTFDDESGLNHLHHALSNIAMMIDSPEHDDRRTNENE